MFIVEYIREIFTDALFSRCARTMREGVMNNVFGMGWPLIYLVKNLRK
jgi:hypothetical protein